MSKGYVKTYAAQNTRCVWVFEEGVVQLFFLSGRSIGGGGVVG